MFKFVDNKKIYIDEMKNWKLNWKLILGVTIIGILVYSVYTHKRKQDEKKNKLFS